MGADDEVDLARGEARENFVLLARGFEAVENFNIHAKLSKALERRFVVLLAQDGVRAHERRLLAV